MGVKFNWYVGTAESALVYLTGVNRRDFFLDAETCRLVYDRGRKALLDLFGDRISPRAPGCAGISYGHMASIGARVTFPDDSEPNVEPMFSNLKEGVKWLHRQFDFSEAPLFKRYYQTFLFLRKAFPSENFSFSGYGYQGPITTAALLRGKDFYMDIYDDPELACEYLRAVTHSIVLFYGFLRRINGLPETDDRNGYVCDDMSSLISPRQWPEFVVPFLEQYFTGITTGKRGAHIENLSPAHLKFLPRLRIESFDPSVSKLLSPKIIRDEIDIEFAWRLLEMDLPRMTAADVEDWVVDAVAQGSPIIYTVLADISCMPENRPKVIAFMDTCRRIEEEGIRSLSTSSA